MGLPATALFIPSPAGHALRAVPGEPGGRSPRPGKLIAFATIFIRHLDIWEGVCYTKQVRIKCCL